MNNYLTWLYTKASDNEGEFNFAVNTEWLKGIMREWATEDASEKELKLETDTEDYINGRTEHLMDEIIRNKDMMNRIYEIAYKENKIMEW